MNSHIYYYEAFKEENIYKLRGEIRNFIVSNHVQWFDLFNYKTGKIDKTFNKNFKLWFGWFRTKRLYLKLDHGLKDVEKLIRHLVTNGWEYHKIVYED